MKFKTESGSTYTIDPGTMNWCRESVGADSGEIRQTFGHLIEWPEVTVGLRCALFDSSVLPGHVAHAVYTSAVTEILDKGVNPWR